MNTSHVQSDDSPPAPLHSPQPAASSLSPSLAAALSREIDPGEQLVWTAQPRPDLARRAAWRTVSPGFLVVGFFGGMVLLLVIKTAGEVMAPGTTELPDDFASTVTIISIIFLFLGALLVGCLTEPGRAAARATRTVYAITDRRAIVIRQSRRGHTEERDFGPDETRSVLRRERADGSGDVIFETPRQNRNSSGAATVTPLGFLSVDRCAEVERILRLTHSQPSVRPDSPDRRC